MQDIDISKIRQLDFTLLMILQGLIRHRRTTVVAEEMGLSQPAISQALGRLRYLFDDPLFVRRAHGLAPTQHTIALVPHIERMLQEAASAIGLASTFDAATSIREFRIGMPEYLSAIVAAPLFRSISKVAPRVSFTVTSILGHDALRQLESHQLDLVVGQFREPIEGLQVEPLYDDRFVLVARSKHPGINRRVSRKLFERLDHVVVSPDGNRRSFADDQLAGAMISRRVAARVPRFHAAFEVVSQSDAVVIAPERLAQYYAKTLKLRTFALPFPLNPIRVVAVRGTQTDAGIGWFADIISSLLITPT